MTEVMSETTAHAAPAQGELHAQAAATLMALFSSQTTALVSRERPLGISATRLRSAAPNAMPEFLAPQSHLDGALPLPPPERGGATDGFAPLRGEDEPEFAGFVTNDDTGAQYALYQDPMPKRNVMPHKEEGVPSEELRSNHRLVRALGYDPNKVRARRREVVADLAPPDHNATTSYLESRSNAEELAVRPVLLNQTHDSAHDFDHGRSSESYDGYQVRMQHDLHSRYNAWQTNRNSLTEGKLQDNEPRPEIGAGPGPGAKGVRSSVSLSTREALPARAAEASDLHSRSVPIQAQAARGLRRKASSRRAAPGAEPEPLRLAGGEGVGRLVREEAFSPLSLRSGKGSAFAPSPLGNAADGGGSLLLRRERGGPSLSQRSALGAPALPPGRAVGASGGEGEGEGGAAFAGPLIRRTALGGLTLRGGDREGRKGESILRRASVSVEGGRITRNERSAVLGSRGAGEGEDESRRRNGGADVSPSLLQPSLSDDAPLLQPRGKAPFPSVLQISVAAGITRGKGDVPQPAQLTVPFPDVLHGSEVEGGEGKKARGEEERVGGAGREGRGREGGAEAALSSSSAAVRAERNTADLLAQHLPSVSDRTMQDGGAGSPLSSLVRAERNDEGALFQTLPLLDGARHSAASTGLVQPSSGIRSEAGAVRRVPASLAPLPHLSAVDAAFFRSPGGQGDTSLPLRVSDRAFASEDAFAGAGEAGIGRALGSDSAPSVFRRDGSALSMDQPGQGAATDGHSVRPRGREGEGPKGGAKLGRDRNGLFRKRGKGVDAFLPGIGDGEALPRRSVGDESGAAAAAAQMLRTADGARFASNMALPLPRSKSTGRGKVRARSPAPFTGEEARHVLK